MLAVIILVGYALLWGYSAAGDRALFGKPLPFFEQTVGINGDDEMIHGC